MKNTIFGSPWNTQIHYGCCTWCVCVCLCVSVLAEPPAVSIMLPSALFPYGEAPHKTVEKWAVKIHYIQLISTQPPCQLNPIVSRGRCADKVFAPHREPYGWKWKVLHFISAETTKVFFPSLLTCPLSKRAWTSITKSEGIALQTVCQRGDPASSGER